MDEKVNKEPFAGSRKRFPEPLTGVVPLRQPGGSLLDICRILEGDFQAAGAVVADVPDVPGEARF